MDEDLQKLKDTLGNMEPNLSKFPELIRIVMSCLDEMQWLREQINNLREVNNRR